MILLYDLAILVYSLLIKTSSLFDKKAKLFIRGRKGWISNLREKVDKNGQYIWIHCASLGEFEQGRPVIEEIKVRFPKYKILVSFFSPSGYEIRKNYSGADLVTYLPMDIKRNAQTFLEILRPAKVLFVKYEFWFHYLNELGRLKIPTYIFSAIFRENQHFFKNYAWNKWFRKMLTGYEQIFVQDEASLKLLNRHSVFNVTLTGDTRFDRVAKIAQSSKVLPIVEKFRDKYPLIVAGSTWKPDEELIIRFINQSEGIRYIIAPHEVSTSNINRIIQLLKKRALRFSQLDDEEVKTAEVIIVDSIGLLSSLYKYGEIAYIGGGFGAGIHNILEAATFGLPVVFGPNHEKFREARDLKKLNAAFAVKNYNELDNIFKALSNELTRNKASEAALNYVNNNRGATEIILKKVFGDH